MSEWEGLFRVSLALLAGALIGFEREWRKKPAGLRTYALVCQGCAVFMVLGILLAQEAAGGSGSVDASRIASTVVQGIGFLAGGVIFTIGARVQGLTTAAGVWVTAAIGLVIGSGFYIIGFGSVVLTLLVLHTLVPVEERIISSEN